MVAEEAQETVLRRVLLVQELLFRPVSESLHIDCSQLDDSVQVLLTDFRHQSDGIRGRWGACRGSRPRNGS